MPNLTFYISQQHAGRLTDLHGLTRACSALCTGILAAESENVHIIYVEVKPGCGHPVYAELFYRLTSERTPEVMAEFMREVRTNHSRSLGPYGAYSLFWLCCITPVCA
ncbi:Uncharacterised protein [Raoultella planticola]|uniref:Uncharacterized protein n=1 Tax=Raoultella planticola TaxID=575 RepID=A0A485CXL2_RAOPL|nr:Uncharacterised protein [Raoultella planticola]